MGHSLGAHIVAWCGSMLIQPDLGSWKVDQVTLWDPPVPIKNVVTIPDISVPVNYIRENSNQFIGIATYVELYDGLLNVGNHGVNLLIDVPLPGHNIDEWYLTTIGSDPKIFDESGKEIVGKTVGYGTTDLARRPDPTCESYCAVQIQKTVSVQYVDWLGEKGHFKQENDCGVCEISGPETTVPYLITGAEIAGDGDAVINGNSFRFWIEQPKQKKQKTLAYEVTCSFPVAVDDWDYVSFDYEFMSSTTQVSLTFSIATETETLTVLEVSPTELFPIGNSGPLMMSQLHGQNVKFIFQLTSENVGDQVVITNLTLARDIGHNNQPPQANAGLDASYEVGPTGIVEITLSGAASADPEGGHLWFSWFKGESYVDDGAEIVVQLTPGIYTFTLQVADEFGAINMDEVNITVTTPSQIVKFIRGDANRDNAIDIADPVKILSYLFASEEASCLDACDVNDSGQIDIADPIYELDYLFAHKDAPPVPFPVAGIDETDDSLNCQQ